ncbi:MAG: hypothetical protein Q4B58_04495 [Bacteroidales bacterium]|nr:hypothetical protein [Bacteroidales bacterium]
MVYKFVVLSDEVDDFRREIEIDAECTFLDLNNILLKTCKYKSDLMTEFYICDKFWDKEQMISMVDLNDDPKAEPTPLMDKTHIVDYISKEQAEKNAKVMFLFDTMCERCLYMEVREVTEHAHQLDPKVILEKGKAPKQEGDIDAMFKGLSDETNAMYGDEDYDLDELDMDGFQDLDDIESAGF